MNTPYVPGTVLKALRVLLYVILPEELREAVWLASLLFINEASATQGV